MKKPYYTYILKCSDNTLYCGYTDDIDHRLARHNAGNGAKYTRGRLPVELLAFVKFSDKETAMKCEWWFKHKLTLAKKQELIASDTLKKAFTAYQKNREK